MESMVISEDLVMLGLEAADWQGALSALAERLHSGGYVRAGFTASLLKREATYPTGLPAAVPVALSHTDPAEVRQSALAVGVLSEPVAFQEMGTPDKVVWVELIFLLVIKDAAKHLELLKGLADLIKDQARLEALRDAKDASAVTEILRSLI
jgi:PTS system galactitol-specific IIA component